MMDGWMDGWEASKLTNIAFIERLFKVDNFKMPPLSANNFE